MYIVQNSYAFLDSEFNEAFRFMLSKGYWFIHRTRDDGTGTRELVVRMATVLD